MTWADFYLVCFVIGFCFSLLSFLTGGLRWHLHMPHLPHGTAGGHLGAGVGHAPAAGGHVQAVGDAATIGTARAGAGAPVTHVSPFNFVTLTAFLAWFGGTGYLLTRYSRVWFVMGLGVALSSGVVGAGIIYLFLSKVLTSQEENMDPADYNMAGVLGKICSPIREGGTGEIIYSQAGTRRTCGARAEDGRAVSKGTEVVVTRYEKGIAYVRLWEELSGEDSSQNKA